MTTILFEKQRNSEKCNCRPPFLFSVPLYKYSDEMERNRDKDSFLKIQRLEKNCRQLKEEVSDFCRRQLTMIEQTKQLVSQSAEVKDNHISRRLKFYSNSFYGRPVS